MKPSLPSISLRLMGLPPTGSHACCTPWSVFQDGHIEGLLPASSCRCSSPKRLEAPPLNTTEQMWPRPARRRRASIKESLSPARPIDADARHPENDAKAAALLDDGQYGPASVTSNAFPLNNFKHFLTLFSKFFSSFPHGTCSLSVSRPYLALDGIYHPLFAAFPNNPTRRRRFVQRGGRRRRGSHPLGPSLPGDLGTGFRQKAPR